MKYIYVILFFVITLTSCEKSYFPDGGIHFRVLNRTENTFKKATIYIGAIIENDFIVTDSINSDILIDKRISSTEAFSETIIYGWKPDLDKIEKKSNNGIFLFKFSNENKLFLRPFNFSKITLDEAILRIYIEEEGLVDYEDPEGNIKQYYEIVK